MTEEKQTLTPIEAINEFYRLKDNYENEYKKKYVFPIIKSDKDKRGKRIEFSRLPKPQCINCKRNVGTIFTIKTDIKEYVRNFIVKCGDMSDPCPLDIQINYSIREQLYSFVNNGSKSIEKLKLEIIKEKNNALFFNKDVVSSFEKITSKLKDETETVGFAIETNILRNDNPEKKLLLKKNIDEFGKGFVLPFKQMIYTYMDKNNELDLTQAVNFYVDEITPKSKEIQEMKYALNYVDYDQKKDTYNLIQYATSLENTEFFLKGDDKVVKFIKGVKNNKNNKKNKPSVNLVIEDDGVEIIDDISEKEEEEEKEKEKEEEEKALWLRVPSKLKEFLDMDKQWKKDYIQSCTIARNNRKPCELFLPRQANFPPEVLEDGSYNFNSEVVNKLFNSLDKNYQKTLLTLYSTSSKNVRDYSQAKNALVNILLKKIDNYNDGYF